MPTPLQLRRKKIEKIYCMIGSKFLTMLGGLVKKMAQFGKGIKLLWGGSAPMWLPCLVVKCFVPQKVIFVRLSLRPNLLHFVQATLSLVCSALPFTSSNRILCTALKIHLIYFNSVGISSQIISFSLCERRITKVSLPLFTLPQ